MLHWSPLYGGKRKKPYCYPKVFQSLHCLSKFFLCLSKSDYQVRADFPRKLIADSSRSLMVFSQDPDPVFVFHVSDELWCPAQYLSYPLPKRTSSPHQKQTKDSIERYLVINPYSLSNLEYIAG